MRFTLKQLSTCRRFLGPWIRDNAQKMVPSTKLTMLGSLGVPLEVDQVFGNLEVA